MKTNDNQTPKGILFIFSTGVQCTQSYYRPNEIIEAERCDKIRNDFHRLNQKLFLPLWRSSFSSKCVKKAIFGIDWNSIDNTGTFVFPKEYHAYRFHLLIWFLVKYEPPLVIQCYSVICFSVVEKESVFSIWFSIENRGCCFSDIWTKWLMELR